VWVALTTSTTLLVTASLTNSAPNTRHWQRDRGLAGGLQPSDSAKPLFFCGQKQNFRIENSHQKRKKEYTIFKFLERKKYGIHSV